MMNDCQNAEIRDRLPDLLHDRLTAGDRAVVLAHVDGCAECRDELELLRGVHQALVAGTPRVNTLRILSALPKPGENAVAAMMSSRPTRSRWADWRVAAAITVIAVGGGSFAVLSRTPLRAPGTSVASTSTPSRVDSQTAAPTAREVVPETKVAQTDPGTTTVRAVDLPSDDEPSEMGMESRLNNLDEQQLKSLLDDIEQMQALPITEPDPITIKVDTKASSSTSGDTEIL